MCRLWRNIFRYFSASERSSSSVFSSHCQIVLKFPHLICPFSQTVTVRSCQLSEALQRAAHDILVSSAKLCNVLRTTYLPAQRSFATCCARHTCQLSKTLQRAEHDILVSLAKLCNMLSTTYLQCYTRYASMTWRETS
jgi:hypothetical protein